MNILIIYFSQTGNTKKVTEVISKTLTADKHKIICSKMADFNIEDVAWANAIGIGSPSFGSGAPSFVKSFIKTLPSLTGKKAFVYATGFGAAGNVLLDMQKELSKKNADVISGYLTFGEMHHPAPSLNGKQANRPNSKDLQGVAEFASDLGKYLKGAITNKRDIKGNVNVSGKVGFYNMLGLLASSKQVLHILEPKPKIVEDKCVQCELCIKECPTNCIEMNEYPTINNKDCVRCYRCMNICPKNAYEANWKLSDKALSILYNEKLMKTFGEYK